MTSRYYCPADSQNKRRNCRACFFVGWFFHCTFHRNAYWSAPLPMPFAVQRVRACWAWASSPAFRQDFPIICNCRSAANLSASILCAPPPAVDSGIPFAHTHYKMNHRHTEHQETPLGQADPRIIAPASFRRFLRGLSFCVLLWFVFFLPCVTMSSPGRTVCQSCPMSLRCACA
jgi:hypothetical protein